MNAQERPERLDTPGLTNGSGAAAVLAAGIGAFALGVLVVAADRVAFIKRMMIFYTPTGPLSGVTTTAIVLWLLAWGILEWRWRSRTVGIGRTNAIALVLLGLSVLLTFPPFADLL